MRQQEYTAMFVCPKECNAATHLDAIATECNLDQLDPEIDKILAGRQQGRVIVDMK